LILLKGDFQFTSYLTKILAHKVSRILAFYCKIHMQSVRNSNFNCLILLFCVKAGKDNEMNNSIFSCFSITAFRFIFKVTVSLFLFSQTTFPQYKFDSFTTDNGLPQNGVRNIAQTPDGYLWFTTFDGLVRFDGVRFQVFDKNNTSGILSNRFFLLHVEPDGTLFAGLEEGGLVAYQNGVFKTYTTADGLPSNAVTFFRNDAKGEFVVGTAVGNCYFRDGKFVPVPDAALPNNNLFYLAPSGNLWLYGKNGIRQITADKREIDYPIKIDYFNDRYSGIVLFEDRSGNLWFGDLSGVYCLKDGNVKKFTEREGVPPQAVLRPYLEDDEGGLWFAAGWYGAGKVGLVRYHENKFTALGAESGLSNSVVSQLYKDREGTIWAATDYGLNHLQKQFIGSLSVREGLVNTEVYPLLQMRNGDIFAGTAHGLSRFRGGKFIDSITKSGEGGNLSVTSLYEDEHGDLWVGTTGVLYKLKNNVLEKISAATDAIFWAISGDRAGNVWLGSNKGLFKLQDEKLVARFTVKDGLPGDDVKFVHEDRRGALWIGTYSGLAKFENGKFTSYTIKDGLASDRLRAIRETDDGSIWIGTYDGGLSRFKEGKFFTFNIGNGLSSNGVFQILEDEAGNFWMSCNKGVYSVKKSELDDLADGKISKINPVAYGKQDGMLSSECNGGRQPAGIKTTDGKLWFPTLNGVAVINPSEAPHNTNPPPVEIEDVLINRQPADFQNKISLEANDENLEIRYTGISFIKPEQIKFRYRIEGLSDDWTDVGTIRELYFPSLPAGEYTFHIIAANSDGVWNTEGARLKISVLAPFWAKTWFIALVSIAAVLLIFAAFRFRVKELKRRQFAQQEFSRKLLESQEQERQRIGAELHDSIGQSLLIIKNRAFLALKDLGEPEIAREQLEELSESAEDAIEECREIAYNLRPFQLESLGLTKLLTEVFQKISEVSATATIIEAAPIDNLFSSATQTSIYRVVQECVNNIIKHSAATEAKLLIERHHEKMEISIADNGRGFDPESAGQNASRRGGFGLVGIAERIRMLGGEYEIDSLPERGTNIKIRLAIPNRNERS
jgi:signal transduction histidine kinase/ligand-binding sensor domain-containing protein